MLEIIIIVIAWIAGAIGVVFMTQHSLRAIGKYIRLAVDSIRNQNKIEIAELKQQIKKVTIVSSKDPGYVMVPLTWLKEVDKYSEETAEAIKTLCTSETLRTSDVQVYQRVYEAIENVQGVISSVKHIIHNHNQEFGL